MMQEVMVEDLPTKLNEDIEYSTLDFCRLQGGERLNSPNILSRIS